MTIWTHLDTFHSCLCADYITKNADNCLFNLSVILKAIIVLSNSNTISLLHIDRTFFHLFEKISIFVITTRLNNRYGYYIFKYKKG